MGSSESKHVASETKPDLPFIKPGRVAQLIDPRSPSGGIDRTPIQVKDAVKSSAEVKSECPVAMTDPRSPSVGITRTPVREVMRATVGTFARRLGMLFHNDIENRVHQKNAVGEEDSKIEEMTSTEPLLTPQPSSILSSLNTHATMLVTPMEPSPPPPQSGDSPFVLLEDPQFEVELETEADLSLEEAEEARETPLHKRLSMSLIACHEGAASTQIYNSVNNSFSTSECVVDPLTREVDHSYAIPAITIQSPVEPSVPDNAAEPCISKPSPQSEDAAERATLDKTKEEEVVKAPSVPVSSTPTKVQTTVPSPRPHHIRCPTIDSKSPSQIVFKPQWLGKGFGGAGQRVKSQGKGGSSPLAVHVAKKTTNENKGQTGKPKQKGTEGRSPLQVLKATNSPRDQRSQMKLKVSTPEKQRLGHTERRVFAVAVDKENR